MCSIASDGRPHPLTLTAGTDCNLPSRAGIANHHVEALQSPHRPEAQDAALSRLKPGFESRWGRQIILDDDPVRDGRHGLRP